MNYITQNQKINSISAKTLIIGIDVGSTTHFARAFDHRNYEYTKQAFKFKNTEEGFEAFDLWVEKIMEKNHKTEVLVGMEPTGHYWMNLGYYLDEKSIRVAHVNPANVKKAKSLDDNNPSKNDFKDPKVIAGLVISGRYSLPYMPKENYANIRVLSNHCAMLTENVTRVKNRITRFLSLYFPEYLEVYSSPFAIGGMMILKRYPFPADIVALGVEGISSVWKEEKLRGNGRKKAIKIFNAAKKSIGQTEGLAEARYVIADLLEEYEAASIKLAAREESLNDLVKNTVKNYDKLLNIPGVGPKMIAGFIAEVGDIRRFNNPKQVQKLAGLSVTENDSGKKRGKHKISYRGRKRLRHIMFMIARVAVRNECFKEIHTYYTTRAKNPLKKLQSIIAIACKILRIMVVILQRGIDFDGQTMLENIKRPAQEELAA